MSSNDYKTKDSVGIQITLVKLKGPNYLLWAKAVMVIIGAKGKLKHLMKYPPLQGSKSFDEWQQNDFMIITWYQSLISPCEGGYQTARPKSYTSKFLRKLVV